jgi:hypothetical protein
MTRRNLFTRFSRWTGIALILCGLAAEAQWRGSRDLNNRGNTPTWEYSERFVHDQFRFTRAEFSGGRGWQTDYPNADLNFSWRLSQMTSLKVHPDPNHLSLLDPELANYPFLCMIDPRSLRLSEIEAEALRNYLLNGGFLMVDDFWGDQMWNGLYAQMKKVFPNIEPVSLPHDHEIFKIVFPLSGPPQVPSEDSAARTMNSPDPYRTWEDEISWEQPQPADFRAYFDDNGRMMALICWNTDLSDGWEEEGVSHWFFENFSEKFSYPMGINIIFYVMTH